MTLGCCDVFVAAIICTIITIVFYIASWYNHEDKDERRFRTPSISNMQGLDNEKPIPRGEPNEIINFDSHRHIITAEHQSTGEIKKEKSDLSRLQDEDLRLRIAENESGEHHIADDYVTIEHQNHNFEYDPVVHPDSKIGRLHLSIRYDDERSQLIVQILEAEGLIRPGQSYAPDMCLAFTLIGPFNNEDDTEKHTRIVVENAPILWKEPMSFCITFENAIKQNLYVSVTNKTDPTAPRDREISIPLKNLGSESDEEINEWFDLQFVQSSY